MAMTQSSDAGGWGAGFKDLLFGVADKAIEYERAKNVDVETSDSGNNVPDRNDLIHNQGDEVSKDALGGTWSRAFGGLTLPQWGLIGGVVLVVTAVVSRVWK